jgi:hypothetical protein
MADLIVLTETAEEITAPHKNGTGTISTHKRRFFPVVGIVAGDGRSSSLLANTQLPLQAVYTAFTGAKTARLHESHRLINPF